MEFSQFPFCQYEKIGEWVFVVGERAESVCLRSRVTVTADIKLWFDIERKPHENRLVQHEQQQQQRPHIQSSCIGFDVCACAFRFQSMYECVYVCSVPSWCCLFAVCKPRHSKWPNTHLTLCVFLQALPFPSVRSSSSSLFHSSLSLKSFDSFYVGARHRLRLNVYNDLKRT